MKKKSRRVKMAFPSFRHLMGKVCATLFPLFVFRKILGTHGMSKIDPKITDRLGKQFLEPIFTQLILTLRILRDSFSKKI